MEANEAARARMQLFVREMVAGLVDDPGNVSVAGTVEGGGLVLVVSVAADDVGRVIGRGGATARSLRSLVSAAAGKHKLRCELVIENGREGVRG